ncbi:G-protein coupled receptor GRL101-like [Littorina saxatilis]|uniref:G-protein coupled receptor GRL101-like n=1 Tax=Littorina saxatilis TaxID=31220 RepID=UPI0038B480B6
MSATVSYVTSPGFNEEQNYPHNYDGEFLLKITDGESLIEPKPLPGNVFNCSVPHFHRFEPLLNCNMLKECEGGEDERNCTYHSNECGKGFYRCRGSKVCLHADNVCDGVPQCPEQDDELLCDLSCPDQCHCQGLAFVCSTSFSASSYSALRYLDASGSVLPASFNLKNCHTVQNLIASCEDLLRSNIYRTFLWIFALLSIVGNIGSFAARVYLNTDSRVMGSFSTFVTNLSIADLCMGVYLAIVGVADLVYRGEYLWHDDEWKSSTACKIAGFLSLLSSEVSALMICLITLDRFIVLRFPFSRFHFRRTSALITCGAVWLVGLALAAVPLLPITSHWEFYSQTGICIPLPFTSSEGFPGYSYSFSVMILLNLVLFLVIAVGQASVFWSIRTNTMSAGTSKKSQEIRIARRLITVVVSDFLCWFPIGLLGVLSATGTPIPGEVNVAVAIFVLPFNSALNPFLYTFNVVMEKRNKAQEAHLLRRLESRMHTETSFSCRIETANAAALQLELNQHVTGDTQNEGR